MARMPDSIHAALSSTWSARPVSWHVEVTFHYGEAGDEATGEAKVEANTEVSENTD